VSRRYFSWVLENRFLIFAMALFILGAGILSIRQLTVDALPDVAPVSVTILTEVPGMAPVEVERQVTNTIEMVMNGIPGVVRIRSKTLFGLSQVTVLFRPDVDIYRARSQMMERLSETRGSLPSGVSPTLGAVSTPTGIIYRYTLEGQGKDLMQLRTLQDWVVKRQLLTVHGVAGVLSYGGYVKGYFVNIDPHKLLAHHLTFSQVLPVFSSNNENVGGGFVNTGGETYLVRGVGRLIGRQDLERLVVSYDNGIPVRISDIAQVEISPEVRRGAALLDGREVVKGSVIMLRGENALKTLDRINKKVAEINNHLLPPGVKIVPFSQAAPLITSAIRTVVHSLLEGSVLVLLVLVLFLGRPGASLVVALTLPMSILMTFLVMSRIHLTADLMSLGGIVIGIGMMVDGSIVMVENMEHLFPQGGEGIPAWEIRDAALEVFRPILFAIAIIAAVFLPILYLPGIPGKMFSPMAKAILICLGASLFLTMTLVPPLMTFVRGRQDGLLARLGEWIFQRVKRGYGNVLAVSLRYRWWVMATGALTILVGGVALSRIGTEFIPVLDEGSLLIIADLWPSASMDETANASRVIDTILHRYPEVELDQARIGRAQSGTDTDVPSHAEIYVKLKDRSLWPSKMTKEKLVSQLENSLTQALPSVSFDISQPIEERIDEMVSGVKAQVAIRIYGDDLDALASYGNRISQGISGVRGVHDVTVQRIMGQPNIIIRVKRGALFRSGLSVSDILGIVQQGIGPDGVVTQVLKGVRRINVHIRLQKPFRDSMESIRSIPVLTPTGLVLTLGEVATVTREIGPSRVFHEGGNRLLMVQFNIRGRSTSHVVQEIRNLIRLHMAPPLGMRISYAGEFQNTQITMARLKILVPLTLMIVFMLLYWNFRSLSYSFLILLNIPFSLTGGVLALLLSHEYLSIPASIGFIALFGVAVQNGVLLLSFAKDAREKGAGVFDAIVEAGNRRVRPVLMTALVGGLGILPLLLSHETGANIQRPLAAVVMGGLVSSTAMTLLVLPAIYSIVFAPKEKLEKTGQL